MPLIVITFGPNENEIYLREPVFEVRIWPDGCDVKVKLEPRLHTLYTRRILLDAESLQKMCNFMITFVHIANLGNPLGLCTRG